MQAVFHLVTAFGEVSKSRPKKLKNKFFSKISFILLYIFYKAHAHYFIVLIYLATLRAAKLGYFDSFLFTILPFDIAKASSH